MAAKVSRRLRPCCAALALLALGACNDGGPDPLPPLDLLEGCNPLLSGIDCTLPFPSDFFRRLDENGKAVVALTGEGRIFTGQGSSATVTDRQDYDGASRTPTPTFILSAAIDPTNLVRINGPYDDTLSPAHGTVLLNALTGIAVAHFVDFDARSDAPERTAVQLRVLMPLEENTRYIVGVHSLVDPSGTSIAASEGFRRLRDGEAGTDVAYAGHAERYESEVIEPLLKFGLARANLQLAWDFTTGSDVTAMQDMLQMRELVYAALQADPPSFTITNVEDSEDDLRVFRKIYGTITGPLVMEEDAPGAEVARDANGDVRLNGTASFTFTAVIPRSVVESFEPAPPLLFGHGIFGDQSEVRRSRTVGIFQESKTVAFAFDLLGLSTPDAGVALTHLGGEEVWRTLTFTDRVVQAMANALTFAAALENGLTLAPAFRRPDEGPLVITDPEDENQNNAGQSFVRTDTLHYLGISLGHILGGVLCALVPKVERCILQVGGGGFSYIMSRSSPFFALLYILDLSVPDRLDQQKFVASMQRGFDRIDPLLYGPFLAGKRLPSVDLVTPGATVLPPAPNTRAVLMQVGLADTSVPNFSSYLHARTLELSLLTPSPRVPYGLATSDEPVSFGLSIFDLGVVDDFSAESRPPSLTTLTHNAMREVPEVRSQITRFLETGVAAHPCDGPCLVPPP